MLWGFISILTFYDSNEVKGLIEWNEVIKAYNFIIYSFLTVSSRVKIFLFNLNEAGNDLSIYTSQFSFIFNENFTSNFVFVIIDTLLQTRKLCQSVNTKGEHMYMQPRVLMRMCVFCTFNVVLKSQIITFFSNVHF